MSDLHQLNQDLYNLSSLFEFRPHWTPNKKNPVNKTHHLDIQSMLAREIFSASSTKNDGQNSNIPLTLGSQIAHLHTFSMNLSLSWSEYEQISFKSKPSQYHTENSPPSDKLDRLEPWFINQNLVFLRGNLTMNSNRKQEQAVGFLGRGFSLYTIVSSFHGSLRPEQPITTDFEQFARQCECFWPIEVGFE